MFFRLRVAAIAALFQGLFVSGIEFSGPTATPVVQNADYDADGWTPKPTGGPKPVMELLRRQDDEDPSFCGYADGDPDQPVSCSVGNCMYDEDFSWFGCCTGTVVTDCYVQTACVPSSSISQCLENTECTLDALVTVCTARSEPYCAFMHTVITGSSYGHFECAPTDTSFQVISTTSGDDSESIFSSESSEFSSGSTEENGGVPSLSLRTSRSPTSSILVTVTPDAESTSPEPRATQPGPTTQPGPSAQPSQQGQGPPNGNGGVAVERVGGAVLGGVVGMFALFG